MRIVWNGTELPSDVENVSTLPQFEFGLKVDFTFLGWYLGQILFNFNQIFFVGKLRSTR